MSIRAVICDIYQTILAIGPPPSDASAKWAELCQRMHGGPPRLSLEHLSTQTAGIIAREHTAARSGGISFPEILWPEILAEVLPELKKLPTEQQEEFVRQQVELVRTVKLLPGAAEGLRLLGARNVLLGIASNAQAYTLHELDAALVAAGLSRKLFLSALSFFSFEHGFSKPDPHVFRLLTARLRLRGVAAQETLMIGNRLDNDVGPARAQGWQTWHFTDQPSAQGDQQGDWAQLMTWLVPLL